MAESEEKENLEKFSHQLVTLVSKENPTVAATFSYRTMLTKRSSTAC